MIDIEELANERMIWRESHSGTRLIVENMLKDTGDWNRLKVTWKLEAHKPLKVLSRQKTRDFYFTMTHSDKRVTTRNLTGSANKWRTFKMKFMAC